MTLAQELKNIIDTHQNIILVPGQDKKLDNLPSSYALALVLRGLNKNVAIYFPYEKPEQLRFLDIQKFVAKHPFEESLAGLYGIIYIGEKNLVSSGASGNNSIKIVGDEESCASEKLTRALKEIDETHINEVVATSLLTGIVASTKNFQNPSIKPQTLFVSAYLIGKRARNELIVQYLYKIKSLEMIKLWASVISNFSHREDKKIGWSFIAYQDIQASNAQRKHIASLVNELKNNFGQASIFALGIEQFQNENILLVHSLYPAFEEKISLKTGAIFQNSSCMLRLHSAYPIQVATEKAVEEIAAAL